MTSARLVLDPSILFEEMRRRLESLGFARQPDTTITPPLVPGEPESASFISPESEARIVYTFNPVVKLRVLAFHG